MPDRLLELALLLRGPSKEVMRLVELGVELDCRFKLPLGLVVLLTQRNRQSPRCVRLGLVGVQFQRLPAVSVGTFQVRLARIPIHVEERATIGSASVGEGELWIDLHGPLEHPAGELNAGSAKLMEELAASQVVLVGLDVRYRRDFDRAL